MANGGIPALSTYLGEQDVGAVQEAISPLSTEEYLASDSGY